MSSILCFFRINFFRPVIGVRHRETTETLGKYFIKSEMGGFKFIKGFQQLTYTHAGGVSDLSKKRQRNENLPNADENKSKND